jgi:TldD protein
MGTMDASLPFPVLGLTGNIASGKTHVARILQRHGWVVLDADQASREVVGPSTEGLRAVLESFGKHLLRQDGTLDREALGALVFKNPETRRNLEALLHPLIETRLRELLQALPPSTKGAVLDAALWVEGGQSHHFDTFWLVEAPEALRLERLMKRDGMQETDAYLRIQSQSASSEKALHADHILLNDGRAVESQVEEAECHLLANWKCLRAARWSIAMDCPFTTSQLRGVLGALLSRGGDYGEVYVESRRSQSLGMEDGRMEDVLASETFGASLRLLDGETTRFADLIAPSAEELLEAAGILAAPGGGETLAIPDLREVLHPTPSPVERIPSEVPFSEKVALVRRAEALARAQAEAEKPGALRQVAVGYGDSTQEVWIASAERAGSGVQATITQDRRIQSVLRASVTVGEGDQLQTGFQALGETRGFELFTEAAVTRMAGEAVRLAIQALRAQPAPAGTFPVILSSSAGGTMIHEACGHGLEADLALAGMSAFAGKLGEKVAGDGVTIIDDGTLPHKRGSSACDDEGQATQRVVLVENGVLRGYLQSRKTARRMNALPTGNGRRESYRHIPIPRMRNTFLAPGNDSPEAILRDLDRGLLVKHMGGGQVDTVTGNFVFQVREGYWVEKGEVKYPVKNATLSGCGPEVLQQITRIAGDLEHFDIGTCGKDGQGVPVSDALPTILCPALVVGGTAEALPDVI